MKTNIFNNLLESKKRKFIFLGESGSGKSEMAINFALAFSDLTNKNIHFFDMDQSKPLYRSRDIKDIMKKRNITFHAGEQYLDSPIVPHGVESIIRDENNLVIFDIGGNSIGSVNIGQYSKFFNMQDTVSYFVINCYRSFSKTQKHVRETINQILSSARIEKIQIISNPNFGIDTTIEDVIYGYKKTYEMLNNIGYEVHILAVSQKILERRIAEVSEHVIKITPYMKFI